MAWKYMGVLVGGSLVLAGCQDKPMERGAVATERLVQGQDGLKEGPQPTDSYFLVPVKEYYEGQVKPVVADSRAQLDSVREASNSVLEASTATSAAVKDVKENVASARQTYGEAKKDVAEAAATVKSGARTVGAVGRYVVDVARKIPTSEKEAAELTVPKEKAFVSWVREKLKAFENFFRRNLDPKRLRPRSRPVVGGNSPRTSGKK